MDDRADANDPDSNAVADLSHVATGDGSADDFRVEFTPGTVDGRFGVFQIFVQAVPIGDGTTTALYPHYRDLQDLCAITDRSGLLERERLGLGDTFDHLVLFWELEEDRVVFTFTTRSEWGAPPQWAPPAGEWVRLTVARSTFIRVGRKAASQFEELLTGT